MGCSVGFKHAKKCIGGRGLLWTPRTGGSSRRSPRPLIVGWGGGHQSVRRFDPRAPRGSLVPPLI